MNTRIGIITLLALGLLTNGCTSMTHNRCLDADWEQIGEDDGDIGRPADTIEQHIEACQDSGVMADREAWRSGYEAGLEDYCSLRGGVETGRKGRTYTRVCAEELEADFLRGLTAGRRIYKAEADVRAISAQLNQYYNELRYNRSLSSELRRRYQFEAIRLEQRLTRAQGDVEYSEQQAAALLRNPD